jgi:hypothetical protein
MPERNAQSGTILADTTQTIVVPNIAAGAAADVALAADASFAGTGSAAKGVRATFAAAPLANLALVGAWVSNTATGVITVRLMAATGGVATANQSVRVERFA